MIVIGCNFCSFYFRIIFYIFIFIEDEVKEIFIMFRFVVAFSHFFVVVVVKRCTLGKAFHSVVEVNGSKKIRKKSPTNGF